MRQRWGAEAANAIAQALQELDGLDNLGDLVLLPYMSLQPDGVDGSSLVLKRSGGVWMRISVGAEPLASGDELDLSECVEVVVADILVAAPARKG